MSMLPLRAQTSLYSCSSAIDEHEKGLYGYCRGDDTTKQLVIPYQYDEVFEFGQYNVAPVSKQKKWGLIDTTGKVLIPFEYDLLVRAALDSNRVVVMQGDNYGVLDYHGHIILPIEYQEPRAWLSPFIIEGDAFYAFNQTIILRHKTGKWGAIRQGKVVVPFEFDAIHVVEHNATKEYDKPISFEIDWIYVEKDNKVYLYNWQKQRLGKPLNAENLLGHKPNGDALVLSKGKVLTYDKDKLVSLPDTSYAYRDKVFRVFHKGKNGVVDEFGKFILPLQYDDLGFVDAEAETILCAKNNLWGAISFDGRIIVPFEYDRLSLAYSQSGQERLVFVAFKGELGAIVNAKGIAITPFQYTFLYADYSDGIYFKVIDPKGKELYLDANGKIIPPEKIVRDW